MLLQPDMAYMYSEEGATGLGLYVAINLYLYQCDGGWGRYTNHMLSVIADENHRRRSDVRRMIECYGLFIIEGDEEAVAFYHSAHVAAQNDRMLRPLHHRR